MDITSKRLTPQEAQEALYGARSREEVEEAVRQGGDVNKINEMTGFSPFHAACRRGTTETVATMIAEGADVDSPIPTGLNLVLDREDPAGWGRDETPKDEWELTDNESTYSVYAGKYPLDLAVKNRGEGKVQALLDAGASPVTGHSPDEPSLLHEAVSEHNYDAAKALLDHGLDPDQPDPYGRTILHKVAGRTWLGEETIELFTDHCNVNALDNRGRSPLTEAILANAEKPAMALMKSGADVKTALSHPDIAAETWTWGNRNLMPKPNQDVEDGVVFDQDDPAKYVRSNVDTLHTVHVLSGMKNDDVATMIRGAYARQYVPFVSEAQGVLHHAETAADVERGIQMGGDVNLVDPIYRRSPFHTACSNNDVKADAVQAMIKHGANLEAPIPFGLPAPAHKQNAYDEAIYKEAQGMRPLDLALERGGHVKTLLDAGASIERGPDEVPVICRTRGNEVKMLLELGADPAAINWHKTDDDVRIGDTPLHIAARHGDTSIVKTLIDHGAPVDAKNTLGETPLVGAIRSEGYGTESTVKTLIKRGADPAVALNHPTIAQTQVSDWVDTDRNDRPWQTTTKGLEIAHAADGRTNLHVERMIKQSHEQVDQADALRKQEQALAKQQDAPKPQKKIGMRI
ncbi:ankyrin repeat domain-containing protein [Burkholderia glumae]|uniref:ankyrin repeat domain-containing protein n=1 Tax=Burkholderia glumae TaxID=337 RepID=UPI00214F8DC2|nr:ankyrin repeat domain-containing protein [Burkholderia glumae]